MVGLWDGDVKKQENEMLDIPPRSGKAAMTIADDMRRKLTASLAPLELVVEDESARHAGHAGARPGGETHFRVRIVSPAFDGLSRIARQRRVHEILSEELHARVHALSIDARAPEETQKTGNH
jgi:BolA protein